MAALILKKRYFLINQLSIRWLINITAVLMFFVCGYLSMNSYLALKTSEANLYRDTHAAQLRLLESRRKILYDQSRFMHFADEQKKLNKQIAKNLQQQINITPYNGLLWKDLFFYQAATDVPLNEHRETFLMSQRLLLWNTNEHIALLKGCELLVSDSDKRVKATCSSLLSKALVTFNAPDLARRMMLTLSDLKGIADHYNVPFNNGGHHAKEAIK